MAPIDKIDALEDLEEVQIDPDHPNRAVKIGTYLELEVRNQLIKFLQAHKTTFAWSTDDMVSVDPNVISHKLNVDLTYRPVRQKRRRFAPERN